MHKHTEGERSFYCFFFLVLLLLDRRGSKKHEDKPLWNGDDNSSRSPEGCSAAVEQSLASVDQISYHIDICCCCQNETNELLQITWIPSCLTTYKKSMANLICSRAILKFRIVGSLLLLMIIVTCVVNTFLLEFYSVRNLEQPANLLYKSKPKQGLSFDRNKLYLNSFDESSSNIATTGTKRASMISVAEFWEGKRTENALIDDYGKNDIRISGELGREVILTSAEKAKNDLIMKEYKVNTVISDLIPLNRLVPDSRIQGCAELQYNQSLPSASVIIPFHNEWLSTLLRTVYSVINRSPRHLLKEIILVDDASTLDILREQLEDYIEANFPEGLVRLLRMPERLGLIAARMRGSRVATGDVLIFFDSHMEVNIDWLPPLLTEIARDRTVVAMATLDYIQADTFEYKYKDNDLNRYGWDWRLVFFETFFREDQIGTHTTGTRPGAAMVGAAFAIERKYFFELGGYDEEMKIWGGENLEMSWRVWLCGGRLLHVPCSRIGHVARPQPYTFPGGREHIELFNYKRAISVWMGNYSRFIYNEFPDMKTMDVGDVSSRMELKSKLSCKDFRWYLQHVWPELNVPDENMIVWGMVTNEAHALCLDDNNYLFRTVKELYLVPCNNRISSQAFSLTTDNLLRTSLQCVVVPGAKEGAPVMIHHSRIGTCDKWRYLQDHSIVHQKSNLCLDAKTTGPTLSKCQASSKSQKWAFKPIHLEIN